MTTHSTRHFLILTLAAALIGCQAGTPAGTSPGKPVAKKATTSSTATKNGNLLGKGGTTQPDSTVAASGLRPLAADAVLANATLIGKVKLISDRGAGVLSNAGGQVLSDLGASLISDVGLSLVSNNSSNIVANNGSGLVSNHGGALVSDQGLGLIGKTKYRVQQTATGGLKEAALADAEIEVWDANGFQLADKDGKPLIIKTDSTGNYKFEGKLPPENLILRVRITNAGELKGGELRAFLPNPGGEKVASQLDIDTPSTLGATYVLNTYIQGRQGVLNKLPTNEVDALKRDMGLALSKASEALAAYDGAAIATRVEALKATDAALGGTLERIKAILLLGQENLGTGLLATEVPLSTLSTIAFSDAGEMMLGERLLGRIRRVALDGKVSVFAGGNPGSELGYATPGILMLRKGPDGVFYATDEQTGRVLKLAKGSVPTVVAGLGLPGQTAAGGAASATRMRPQAIAWNKAGRLYIGEAREGSRGRISYVDEGGILREVPTTGTEFEAGSINSLVFTPDDTLYALVSTSFSDPVADRTVNVGRIMRLKPGETAWQQVVTDLAVGTRGRIASDGADGLLVSEDEGHRVFHLAADMTTRTPLAGSGLAGYAGDGATATAAQLNTPSDLTKLADGRVFVVDAGNGLVRAISKDGIISTVAGQQGLMKLGDGQAFAVSIPSGLAIDAAGNLLVSESGSHTVKRFDGKSLNLVAGGQRGFVDGAAAAAKFDEPFGIGFTNDTLYIADSTNHRIRKLDAAGTVTTVAGVPGNAPNMPHVDVLTPVTALSEIGKPLGLAIRPLTGLPTWCIATEHQVMRLRTDGQIEMVAGKPYTDDKDDRRGYAGDGGPASAAKMLFPTGCAYDSKDNLYIADMGNMRIRKVTPDGTISTFAGIPAENDKAYVTVMGALGDTAAARATKANEVVLGLPFSIAIDANDNVYVGEIGTVNISGFGAAAYFTASDPKIAQALDLASLPGRIRRISQDGTVTIIAGPGGRVMTDRKAEGALILPSAIAIKPDGSLVVADSGSNQVHLIPKAALE